MNPCPKRIEQQLTRASNLNCGSGLMELIHLNPDRILYFAIVTSQSSDEG